MANSSHTQGRGSSLLCQVEREQLEVSADKKMLEQLLINLLKKIPRRWRLDQLFDEQLNSTQHSDTALQLLIIET